MTLTFYPFLWHHPLITQLNLGHSQYQNKKALFTDPVFSDGFGMDQSITCILVSVNRPDFCLLGIFWAFKDTEFKKLSYRNSIFDHLTKMKLLFVLFNMVWTKWRSKHCFYYVPVFSFLFLTKAVLYYRPANNIIFNNLQ